MSLSKLVARESIHRGFLTLVRDTVDVDGEDKTFEVVLHPGAVAILPIKKIDGDLEPEEWRIVLTRQYRHAVGGKVLELPAGTLERGEDPLECATRELREETGMEAVEIEYVTAVTPSPGYTAESILIYFAYDCVKVGEQDLDEHEDIELREMTLTEALEQCVEGEISDAKTMLALFLLMAEQRMKMPLVTSFTR